MKNRASFNLLRGLAAASLALVSPHLFPLEADAAWSRAASLAAESKRLSPGLIRFESLEYGKQGEILSREESISRISYDVAGKSSSQIIKATKDGKDVTEEKRAEAAKQKGPPRGGMGSDGGFGMPDPLNPEKGASVIRQTPVRENRDGVDSWKFPFEYKKKGTLSSAGFLWIEAETGRPTAMEYKLKPLPLGVKHADFSLRFSAHEGSGVVIDWMRIGFDVNLLVFNKRMDMEISLSDYADRGFIVGE